MDERLKPGDPQNYEEQIYNFIKDKDGPTYIKQISEELDIPRNTVRQWVTVLAATGRIHAVAETRNSTLINTK